MSEKLTQEQRIDGIRKTPLSYAILTSSQALSSIAGLAQLAEVAPESVSAEDRDIVGKQATDIARVICRRLLAHLDGDYAETLRLHDEGAALLEECQRVAEEHINAALKGVAVLADTDEGAA